MYIKLIELGIIVYLKIETIDRFKSELINDEWLEQTIEWI